MKQLSDPTALEGIIQWEKDNKTAITIFIAICRHSAYCLLNIAFAFNLERWWRILQSRGGPDGSLKVSLVLRNRLMLAVWVFVVTAVGFMVIQATNNLTDEVSVVFYLL